MLTVTFKRISTKECHIRPGTFSRDGLSRVATRRRIAKTEKNNAPGRFFNKKNQPVKADIMLMTIPSPLALFSTKLCVLQIMSLSA